MLDTICDIMKAAYARGWITSRDGNVSFRRKDQNHMYITPSAVRKQTLTSEQMIKLDMSQALEFEKSHGPSLDHYHLMVRAKDEYQDRLHGFRPSGELPLHWMLQRKISENRCVVHLHPTYTIAAMHAGYDLQNLTTEFPEITRYTNVGPTLPMIEPVTEELAREGYAAFDVQDDGAVSCDIIGLDRHGVVAIAKDAWTALEHVERLEHICQIALIGSAGRKVSPS